MCTRSTLLLLGCGRPISSGVLEIPFYCLVVEGLYQTVLWKYPFIVRLWKAYIKRCTRNTLLLFGCGRSISNGVVEVPFYC